MSEESKDKRGKRRGTLFRLLKITIVLFPISWMVYSLLVKSLVPFDGTEESARHFVEWMTVLAATIGITFLISLLELKGRRGVFTLFILLAGVGFMVILAIGRNAATQLSGKLFVFSFLCAIGWALAGLFLISFIRWLGHWRNLKRFLFGLACFITLIALFYAEEDWRGLHDWNQFKRAQEAKGEKFDFKDFAPPPVPDDQNFAMAPIWVESIEAGYGSNVTWQWYGKKLTAQEQSKLVNRLDMPLTADYADWPTNSGNWQKATLTDLKPWQKYYRTLAATTNLFPISPQPQTPAQDVLLALSKYDSTIEELRAASERPYSQFPLNYNSNHPFDILLPHLAALKRCAQVLELRSIAELENNESDKALNDVKLMLHLTDSVRTEPFLISHLVRLAILQITLQPIYQGLAEHKWSDAQLADLDAELAKLNFLADCEHTIRGERALEIADIDFLRHPGNEDFGFRRPHFYFFTRFFSLIELFSDFSASDNDSRMPFQTITLGFGPSGWIDQNELRIAQFETKWDLPIVDEDTETISPAKVRAAGDALKREIRHRTPENILEIMLMPALGNALEKFAYAQSSTDLARVAIALERYRLTHGDYPDSLNAIAAQFPNGIPHDVINGQPLNYHRTSDGQFVLYSVGWNETDDGGVVKPRVVGVSDRIQRNPIGDYSQGDWVWRYPQK